MDRCPPMPSATLFARMTMAAAFQRTSLRMRRSTCSSPGKNGCCEAGIVLRYGVEVVGGTPSCCSLARSSSLATM